MVQKKQLDVIEPLIEAKMAELKYLIELRRDNKVSLIPVRLREGRGKRLMDSIRAEMNIFNNIESDALSQKDKTLQSNLRRMLNIIICAGIFWTLFTIALIYLIFQQSQQKLKNLVHKETRHLLEDQEETNKQLRQLNAKLQDGEEKTLSNAQLGWRCCDYY